jgi:hypothetical protein
MQQHQTCRIEVIHVDYARDVLMRARQMQSPHGRLTQRSASVESRLKSRFDDANIRLMADNLADTFRRQIRLGHCVFNYFAKLCHGESKDSFAVHLLIEAELDPSVIVGANCPQLNGGGTRTGSETIPSGLLAGTPGIFVAEACEFNRSFHSHQPTMALINNVEEDHLDVYGSLDEIVKSFRVFAGNLPAEEVGGRLLIGHDGAAMGHSLRLRNCQQYLRHSADTRKDLRNNAQYHTSSCQFGKRSAQAEFE